MREIFDELVKFVEKHTITPTIDSTFTLEEISTAHDRIESRQNIGKVILKI
jgi:NADPH:quinone reductase-like Zn-dependent oxidoreductase